MERKSKPKKNLAEDCFQIKLSFFGKKLLYPINNDKLDYFDRLQNKENNVLRGKNGYFTLKNGIEVLHVFYNINQNKTPKLLELRFQKQENEFGGTSQIVELEEDLANFGIRLFLKCQCGRNSTVLYKSPEQNIFKCRICSNICYESQKINRHNMDGLFWYVHKLIKLAKMRESIKRMHYGGKFTKKAKRFTDLYLKWSGGVNKNIRTRAEDDLQNAIKGNNLKEELVQFL